MFEDCYILGPIATIAHSEQPHLVGRRECAFVWLGAIVGSCLIVLIFDRLVRCRRAHVECKRDTLSACSVTPAIAYVLSAIYALSALT